MESRFCNLAKVWDDAAELQSQKTVVEIMFPCPDSAWGKIRDFGDAGSAVVSARYLSIAADDPFFVVGTFGFGLQTLLQQAEVGIPPEERQFATELFLLLPPTAAQTNGTGPNWSTNVFKQLADSKFSKPTPPIQAFDSVPVSLTPNMAALVFTPLPDGVPGFPATGVDEEKGHIDFLAAIGVTHDEWKWIQAHSCREFYETYLKRSDNLSRYITSDLRVSAISGDGPKSTGSATPSSTAPTPKPPVSSDHPASSTSGPSPTPVFQFAPPSTSPAFTFGAAPISTTTNTVPSSAAPPKPTAPATTAASTTPTPAFTFGAAPPSTTAATGQQFSFGTSSDGKATPCFSFGNPDSAPAVGADKKQNANEGENSDEWETASDDDQWVTEESEDERPHKAKMGTSSKKHPQRNSGGQGKKSSDSPAALSTTTGRELSEDEAKVQSMKSFVVQAVVGTAMGLHRMSNGHPDAENYKQRLQLILANYFNGCWLSLLKQDDDFVTDSFADMGHRSPVCLMWCLWALCLSITPDEPPIIASSGGNPMAPQALEGFRGILGHLASQAFDEEVKNNENALGALAHTCTGKTLSDERAEWKAKGCPDDKFFVFKRANEQ